MKLIPPDFVKGASLANVVVLKVPGGEEWQVEVSRCNGDVWFQDGWQAFADFYSLGHGNFVVFNYQGNSQFSVAIVNGTTCVEIKYRVKGTRPSRGDRNGGFQEQGNDAEEDNVLDHSPPNLRKRKEPSAPCFPSRSKRISSKTTSSSSSFFDDDDSDDDDYDDSRTLTMEASVSQNSTPCGGTKKMKAKMGVGGSASLCGSREKTRLPRYAIPKGAYKGRQVRVRNADSYWEEPFRRARAFKSKHPHFVNTVKRTNFPPASCLTVPSTFANKFLTETRDHVILSVSGVGSWNAMYKRQYYKTCDQVKLIAGWAAFVRANKLKIGDSCVFELVNNVDITFRVHIFRIGEQPSNTLEKKSQPAASKTTSQPTPVHIGRNSSRATQTAARSFQGKLNGRGKGIQEDSQPSERERVAEEINSIVLENPYFVQVLKDYHRHKMVLPKGFARAAGLQKKKRIVIKDMEGREWPVEICVTRKQSVQVYFSTGFSAFLQANNLVPGDTVVFHFMKTIGQIHVQIHPKGGAQNEAKQTLQAGKVKSEPESSSWDF
ncbi:hypothetical protein Tsubulata_009866 [Turnera subulata]|uniref:TF-B3 domain-containing protein n=1 Tax=Turnera subulata TaxID=218843 RepID=A0A9Q0G4X2_9ROSI|nr:hypothetical protein Tsubulata_009866 [Turnera subulata]